MKRNSYKIEVANDKTHRVFDEMDAYACDMSLEGLTCEQAVRAKQMLETAFSHGFVMARQMAIEELMRLGHKP